MYIYESPKKENGFYQKESPKGMFSFNLIFILMFFCYLCMLNTSMGGWFEHRDSLFLLSFIYIIRLKKERKVLVLVVCNEKKTWQRLSSVCNVKKEEGIIVYLNLISVVWEN